MGLRRIFAAHPFVAAVIAEGAMIPLALALALLLGQAPWAQFGLSWGILLAAVAATAPLVAGLMLCGAAGSDWFRGLDSLVRPMVDMLFRGRGHGAVIVAAALAGLGEELLFRGVLQASLVDPLGAWSAVVIAAAVFGFLHAVSRAYFVVATVMGLYLGALYQLTGNLLLASLVHALYDWIAIEYLLHGDDAEPERADG